MPPSNQAAYLTGPKAQPLEVSSAPYHLPGPHEVLIQNRAFGIAFVDAGKQAAGDMMFTWLKYPAILGNDVAGEVVAVGERVTHFKPGDRVTALAMGMDKRGRQPEEGGFQEFTVTREALTAKIPDHVAFKEAVVLPLALGTASCGLFEKGQLGLEKPVVGKKVNGKTVLIWGASTSVGMCAVQLATAAGYEVFATASPKNWDVVRSLGASKMFDYKSADVVDQIAAALQKTNCAGAMAIGDGSLGKCVDIVARVDGVKVVAQASIDLPGGAMPQGGLSMIPFVAKMLWGNLTMWFKLKSSGVRAKFIWGSDLVDWDKDDRMVFGFLEKALEAKTFTPAPEPDVIGNGLGKIQEGLDLVMKGVSAKKLVVTMEK